MSLYLDIQYTYVLLRDSADELEMFIKNLPKNYIASILSPDLSIKTLKYYTRVIS